MGSASHVSGVYFQNLTGTKIEYRSEDDVAYVADYPLLPIRRRFWEKVLRAVDVAVLVVVDRASSRVQPVRVGDELRGQVVPVHPHGEGGRRGGGRNELEAARFTVDADVEVHVGVPGERRGRSEKGHLLLDRGGDLWGGF